MWRTCDAPRAYPTFLPERYAVATGISYQLIYFLYFVWFIRFRGSIQFSLLFISLSLFSSEIIRHGTFSYANRYAGAGSEG